MLSLELLDKDIAECAVYVKAGKENQSTLDKLLSLREDLRNRSEADWLAYNELVEHLPPDDADPLLIILKGHLLIEKLIRKFICSRLLNPEPFEKRGFGVAQCIAIAESMCLKNDDPAWLWIQVRELNTIRNKLAHSFIDENLEERISRFIATIANKQHLHNQTITSVISRIYGMLKGLCDLAESDGFKIPNKI